jgi:phosphate transport system protein
MREIFRRELDHVGRDLRTMADLAAAELRGASVALLEAEETRAHEVLRGTEAMGQLQDDLEARLLELVGRSESVAGGPRLLFAALRISVDLERMSAIAGNIARVAERRHPARAIPAVLTPLFARMADASAELADGASHILGGQDFETVRSLEVEDDAVEALYRWLLTTLFAPGAGYDAGTAVDLALVGHYYERFADHAVSIARRLESVGVVAA